MKNIVFIVTNNEGEAVYASLNKDKAFDYAFKNGLTITGCELEELEELKQELEELKQRISGDTPNCYECGSQIEFDGKYPKFTKTIEESKVINVCEKCF